MRFSCLHMIVKCMFAHRTHLLSPQRQDIRRQCTCFENLGFLLGNSGLLANATLVLGVHPELVCVAHDKVRDCGIQSMVMLHHGVPVLEGNTPS